MVISVTPMVCITLAFWLGRIGLIASGGCCACASGAAQMTANRIAKVKRESRFREIIVALLVVEFGALCIAPRLVSKGSGALCNKNLQLFTNPAGSTAACFASSCPLERGRPPPPERAERAQFPQNGFNRLQKSLYPL